MIFPSWSLIAGLLTLSALKMGGSDPPGNSTSTTAPSTWVIFPMLILTIPPFNSSLQRFRRADDFHQLAGDRSLTRPVHLQGQTAHHFGRVAGCRIHRRHARAMFAGNRLQ